DPRPGMADQVKLQVPDALDGSRVDKAIAELFDVSRAVASGVVEEGVLVDGSEAAASDRVRAGQVIVCRRPEDTMRLAPEAVDFEVVYEDQSVIVVDKPAGVVVHPGSGRTSGTLAAGLLDRYPELEGVGAADRWGLVHRLDKDTSGVIVVARTSVAFDQLTAELRRREIERVYVALVEGRMSAPTGTVDAPIGRDPSRPTRRAVVPGGKHARTHYEVVRYYQESDVSLLEVRLETGRTHQIRVHLAAIDHPVAGDATYGATRRDLTVPRTFLHAAKVAFTHPTTGKRLEVEAPLPADLATVLDRLS
ncbi:MAG: RluA family pseudouridine synthase, partial [Actinomycetota bacterium]